MLKVKKIIVIIILFLSSNSLFANEFKNSFFVSTRSNKVNLRIGPGNEYPIKLTYNLEGIPLKVVGEYENWYKILDKDNDEGWVSKNLTTKKRNLIVINGTQILYKKDNLNSNPIARLEENLILKLEKCNKEWCRIEIEDKKGWVENKNLWGYLL